MKFICLFLPAVLASKYELDGNEKLYDKVVIYSKYCIYINFLMLTLLFLVKRGSFVFDDMGAVRFYLAYLFGSFVLSYVVPRMVVYCKKNFKINIKRNK